MKERAEGSVSICVFASTAHCFPWQIMIMHALVCMPVWLDFCQINASLAQFLITSITAFFGAKDMMHVDLWAIWSSKQWAKAKTCFSNFWCFFKHEKFPHQLKDESAKISDSTKAGVTTLNRAFACFVFRQTSRCAPSIFNIDQKFHGLYCFWGLYIQKTVLD